MVDGTEVVVDFLDLDGVEWRDLKRVTGLGRSGLMTSALMDRDLDAIGAFIWIKRRRDEPGLTYEDTLRGLTLRALVPPEDAAVDSEEEAETGPPD